MDNYWCHAIFWCYHFKIAPYILPENVLKYYTLAESEGAEAHISMAEVIAYHLLLFHNVYT